ncbi:MAG: HAD family hydrolase [Phycisphaerae bacterium]
MSERFVELTGIAVIVFDLDDTLYPEREFVWSGFEAVGNWLRQQMDCPDDPARRMRELFESGCRRRVFDELLAEWGCAHPEDWVQQMIACYRDHDPVIQLYPDAEAAVAKWHGTFQLSLISDGPVETQQNKLRKLRLESLLEPIVLTDEWGEAFRKPHRRAFEYVESVTGCRGQECVYIGDNPLKDFVAPNQLTWRSVCVCRKEGMYADAEAPPEGQPEFRVPELSYILISK